jgi:uncharacterized hydantoinase/oxoprolinase family protein
MGKPEFTYLLNDNEFLSQIIEDVISEFRENIDEFKETYNINSSIAGQGETLIEDLPQNVEQLLNSLSVAPTIESVAKRLPYLYNDLITELYYCRW